MFKKTVVFLHRWLGLISGIVVLILSITGAIFVFQKEFTHWLRKDIMHVENSLENRLPIGVMEEKTEQALGVEKLNYGLVTYKDPTQSWTAFSYVPDEHWTYMGSVKEYNTAYMDQYSGETLAVVDEKKDFFQIVKGIHWSLLLSTPIGVPIVAVSTIIFLILLITGMVLWWPKKWNQAGKNKSFKVKWGAKWRRINYDLHNVLGFYVLLLALIVGFTGLYWAFPFVKKTLHFIGTGEYKLPEPVTLNITSAPGSGVEGDPLEIAYRNAWDEFPNSYSIALTTPSEETGTIKAVIRGDSKTYYEKSEMHFDQYSGEVLQIDAYDEKNAGEKLIAMNYDIHVGAIGGLPGKIIALLVCVVCGSLPVTGFIIWFDKKRRGTSKLGKKPKRKSQKRNIKVKSNKKDLLNV